MEKDGGGLVTGNGLGNQCQNLNQPFQAIVPTTFVQSKISKAYPTSSLVLPFSLDCILSIYNELVKLVDRIPFQKHLVVTIVCRGSKFRIDLGEVRAAGVVCLIGLGLSLGTLLLYKLYLRIIIPFLRSLRAGKGNNPWLDDEYTLYLDDSESEVDSMGNNGSKRSPVPNVYYSRRNSGITLGSPRPTSPTSPHSSSSKSDLVHIPYVPATASSRASSVASGESATSSSLAVKPPDNVRLRPRHAASSSSSSSTSARHKSPSPGSDKDSAIGGVGGSEMSQSMYSENSINNRDSFYSTGTMESGFDDLGGYLEELRSSKKLTGSLKENFSPNSLRERSLQMLYRAHRGGRDQGLNAIAGNGSGGGGGLDALSDCDSTHSGILSSCSTRSSCCSSDGTFVTRTNIDPLEQKMAAGQGHQRPHHHHHHRQQHQHRISGGDKPGIGFSTTTNGDKSARNSISNSNNSYNRQFSNSSSSGNSKSSPYRPSSSCTAVGGPSSDRLHHSVGGSSSTSNSMGGANNRSSDHSRLPCRNNTGSSFDDEWRCGGSSEQLSSSSPYRASTCTTPHRHHNGNNPSTYSDEELCYDNTASINSFDTSEDYDDINWQDGGREQEEEMVDRVREGGEELEEEEDVDDDNGRRLSALPEHLNQSLSDLHFRQSLMQRIQEWSSFAEEYNKSMSPTPECSPIRFVRRSRSLDCHLGDSSVIACESEIPSSRPLEIEPVTEKNLETLEYELHDIQGEFESITSKLHDLIEQQQTATPSVTPSPLSTAPMSSSYPAAFTTKHSTPQSSSVLSSSNNNNNNHPHHRNRQVHHPNPASDNNNIRQTVPMQSHHPHPHHHHHEISSSSCSPSPKRRFESKSTPSTPCINKSSSSSSLRKMKTKWERVPGSACSDCSRSSRGSSVEYVWDMADYSTANSTIGPASTSASADRSRSSPATGRRISVSRNSGGIGMPSTDLCPTDASDCVCNINQPMAILDYCQQEWKGDTPKAAAIRQGYHQIPSVFGCQRMCVIRGDNYCALRSTLFQVLVAGVRIVPSSWGIIGIMDRLHDHFDDPTIRMSAWNFAYRLPGHTKDKLASISKCALSLYATVEEVCNLPTREEREKRTINLFNASLTFDLELMEGVKVMMLLQLVSLRQRILDGEGDGDGDGGVPMFGHLLFARDSSETVADFIHNHLNRVGDSGGLEQVEMCLLGYTLGVSIKVLRLSQTGQEDSQCCFPDDMPAHTPQVVLMAEDDRHYNVPLP